MHFKKFLCLFLTLVLALSVLPFGAFAEQSEPITIEGPRVHRPVSRVGIGVPTLAQGNHVRYLDRIAGLPQYALSFYSWLEDNANARGALADVTKGSVYEGDYYYPVTCVTGSKTFTYSSYQDMMDTMEAVVDTALSEEFAAFSGYAAAVYDAFDRDHPEVFWLSGQSSYSYLGSWYYSYWGNSCTVYYEADMVFWLKYSGFDIRSEDYCSANAVAAGIRLRDASVEEILADCPDGDAWEQVRYLNQELTHRNAYNRAVIEGKSSQAAEDAWECISALDGRSGNKGPVCEGYARAFMILCRKLEIPCVLVSGTAKSDVKDTPKAHMWNYVCLDGGWYAVDVTWNDPYISNYPEKKDSGYESEKWLGLGGDTQVVKGLTFLTSHIMDNDVSGDGFGFTNGPVLESAKYVPGAAPKGKVTGTITSFGDPTIPVTVELWADQSDAPAYSVTVAGNATTYTIEKVVPGEYTLKIIKKNHTPRSYRLTVTDVPATQDCKLHQNGDLSGDGRINVGDVAKIYSHIRGNALITDEYMSLCADITGDGRINVGDTARLYGTVKNG